MSTAFSNVVLAYHGCDKEVAMKVLSGKDHIKLSKNKYDWLGYGAYYWEQDPTRALQYAKAVADGKQYAKTNIKTPFVIGAIIDLGNCLNLTTPEGIVLLKKGYNRLKSYFEAIELPMPENDGDKRNLDRAVIESIVGLLDEEGETVATVKGAFQEGNPAYEGTSITEKNHIQISVRTLSAIKGYFLPQPIKKFNPFIDK